MTAVPSIVTIPQPFAANGDKAVIGNASTSSAPNYTDGFPATFSAYNGPYPTRQQFNGLFNIATANQYAAQCGQINTFNSELATAIGGYAAGAILDYYNGGTLLKVVSLVNGNTYNFVENGVDGVNWAYCSSAVNKSFPDCYHSQELINESIQATFNTNKNVINGAISEIYTLNSTGDFFVAFSFITRATTGNGYDLEFALRNVNASTSEVSWTPIQSAMWISGDSSGTGYINGNIYLHGGQSFAIVNPTNVTASAIDAAWLTIRAFPLIA